MRGDAAGDQIEACVLERQRLGLGIGGADIGEAALLRLGPHHVEHLLRDVGRPHAFDMRRKRIGDVAAAGGDIERAPALLRGGQRHQPLQAGAFGVRLAGEVLGVGLAELFLDEGLAHDAIRSGPAGAH